jgi:ABC-type transporter Mla MlaB component
MQPGSGSGFAPLDVTPEPSTNLMEMRGEIHGDADQTLQDLHAQLRPGDPMVISLALVIRVDFPAAASILNWLVAHQSETGRVQFVHVPRLVAAFFEVMGITGMADISLVKAAP